MRVTVAGGCGFVGSTLALGLAEKGHAVTALDNLKRRGSERNIPLLAKHGVRFVHGDVRNAEDLRAAGDCDVLLECSAEPSVHAGYGESPAYLVNTNLTGAVNCLEFARERRCGMIFLSSSRVYPIAALRSLPLHQNGDRLALNAAGEGWSEAGVSTEFPLRGNRSLYGATKLAAELLLEEYCAMYSLPAVVNRCGVIAGPRQMGRVDQGFFSLWAARHLWNGSLSYTGFGGEGLQVRDVLHAEDLLDLVTLQLENLNAYGWKVWNVGGGIANSVSLRELTALCRKLTGNEIPLAAVPETAPADIPWYVTDNAAVTRDTGWEPRRSVRDLALDVLAWLRSDAPNLQPFFR